MVLELFNRGVSSLLQVFRALVKYIKEVSILQIPNTIYESGRWRL